MINFMEFNYSEKNFFNAISDKTISFHYNKHLKAYVDKTNELIAGSDFSEMTLEDIILASYDKPEFMALYNNAGQVYNHNVYFNSFGFSKKINDDLKSEMIRTFGSMENLKEELVKASVGVFGSGWTWLVRDKNNNLKIMTTRNGDTPLVLGYEPLFNIDVWEHAYYLDYQNLRKVYVEKFIDNVLGL